METFRWAGWRDEAKKKAVGSGMDKAYVVPSTKMRMSPIKLQGRMVVPRMVATSEKNVQLAFLNDQAKQLKSMV